MVKIFIIYHSGAGHTKVVADEIAKGIREVKNIDLHVLTSNMVLEALDELDEADAIIVGCPTYMGGPSAEFKSFIDATSPKMNAMKWMDKIAAGFTNSGSLSGDKSSTLEVLFNFAMGHGMIWVGQSHLAPHHASKSYGGLPEEVNRLGSYSGLMTQSDDVPASNAPAPGDKRTARLFGRRIAQCTMRWVEGERVLRQKSEYSSC